MLRERVWVGSAALAVLLALAPPGTAQQPVVLRYEPTVGQRAHSLWWVETTAIVRDAANTGDSILLEIRGQQSISHRVMSVEGSMRSLEVTFDSARPRMRPAGGVWTAVDLPFQAATVRLHVDNRYRVLAVDTVLRDSVPMVAQRALRGFAAGFEFAFPEGPTPVGGQWSADVVLPLVRPAGIEEEPVLAGRVEDFYEVVARTSFVLDSVVPYGPDTLSFLTVQGSFMPGTVAVPPERGGGETTVRGAFAGSLVWSVGWEAFVTGAIRTRATLTMLERSASEAGEPEPTRGGILLTLDTTARFQVRR